MFHNFPNRVVPKSEPGQYTITQHLSYPEKTSINDGIAEEFKTVSYASIDDAISRIKSHGSKALMCKTDIDSAFRLIPMNPEEYPLLGIKFNHRFYYDMCVSQWDVQVLAIYLRDSVQRWNGLLFTSLPFSVKFII